MIDSHMTFETLCALASGGQLTEKELSDLQLHSDACAVCREQLHEMGQVAEGLFLSYALAESHQRIPKGMRERFIARANCEGIPLKPRTAIFSHFHTPLLSAFALLVLAVCIAFTWHTSVSSENNSSQAASMVSSGTVIGSQQEKQIRFNIYSAPAAKVLPKRFDTRKQYSHRLPQGVVPASLEENSDLLHETRAPQGVIATNYPRLTFSNNPAPYFSLRSDSLEIRSLVQRETSAFDRPFFLNEQKPLLEASSSPQGLLPQYNYFPNRTQNFSFLSPDLRALQGTAH
jgi:hypothetical protein